MLKYLCKRKNKEVHMKSKRDYADALSTIKERSKLDVHSCMDFLESIGYSVAPLGNNEIVQLTEDIIAEMEQAED